MLPFRENTFFYCFDCGWGEKGVHEGWLTFDAAYSIIEDRAGKEAADNWVEEEDEHCEFRPDYYMISERMFDRDEWEGSDDY